MFCSRNRTETSPTSSSASGNTGETSGTRPVQVKPVQCGIIEAQKTPVEPIPCIGPQYKQVYNLLFSRTVTDTPNRNLFIICSTVETLIESSRNNCATSRCVVVFDRLSESSENITDFIKTSPCLACGNKTRKYRRIPLRTDSSWS